ncbi:alpha/beta fold hydrolase [Nannocystis pusilla]|uniref:alpha/beta fold hydrolase n=1 Tax=Nannocystis pusilla TaxID=889268 RepID=UPI003BF2C23B
MPDRAAESADAFVECPGGERIAYTIRGPARSGLPVLLIRPLGGSMTIWGRFLDRLAEERRVVAFDHRGVGRSLPGTARVTTEALARDSLRVLDDLGIARAHVFGVSLGGMVATRLALLAAQRIGRLCLASTPARGLALSRTGLRFGAALAACLAQSSAEVEPCLVRRVLSRRFRETHPEEVARLEGRLRQESTDRATIARLALAAARHDARRELHRITAPTLVLAGADDPILGVEASRELAAGIVGAEFVVIPVTGHDPTLEQPSAAAMFVARFIAAE